MEYRQVEDIQVIQIEGGDGGEYIKTQDGHMIIKEQREALDTKQSTGTSQES